LKNKDKKSGQPVDNFSGFKNTCPICSARVTKKNPLVVYHIRYSPPLVILACKYCNYTEWALRKKSYPLPACSIKTNPYKMQSIPRAKKVILYHHKLGLKI